MMTNYDKLAGTPERFADFFVQIYDKLTDEVVEGYCQGMCRACDDDDVNCTDENLKKCVLTWLMREE